MQNLDSFKKDLKKFTKEKIKTRAEKNNESEKYDTKTAVEICKKGWLGISAPEKYKGGGKNPLWTYEIIRTFSQEDITAAAIITGQFTLVAEILINECQEDIKNNYVPRILNGEINGCYALTEPDAGSNPSEMKSRVKKTEKGWILNGQKMWITNGNIADLAIVYAKEDDAVSCFLVDMKSKGISKTKIHGKMGFKSSDTAEISFENVFIPDQNRIGKKGKGLSVAFKALDNGRLGISVMALGAIEGIQKRLIEIAKNKPSQKNIEDVAKVEVIIESCRSLISKAIDLKSNKKNFTKYASMAKLKSTEGATKAANMLTDKSRDKFANRVWRDVRVMELFEGTSEIQKLIIGNMITGFKAFN